MPNCWLEVSIWRKSKHKNFRENQNTKILEKTKTQKFLEKTKPQKF